MNAHRSRLVVVLPLVAAVAAVGCASGGDSGAAATTAGGRSGRDCVFLRTVDNWQVVDDSRLVIWTSGRAPYLVTLFRRSPELRFAVDLAFEDGNRDGQLCGYGGDAVITGRPMSDRLLIDSVAPLSEKQLDDLLAGHETTRGERHEK